MKDGRALKWIKSNFYGYRISYGFLIAFSALKAALTVFLAVAIKWTINAAEHGGNLLKFSIILVITAAMELVTQMIMRLLRGRVRYGVEVRLKNRIFYEAVKKDYAAVSAYHSGDILNRISSDTATVANGASDFVPRLVLMITRLAGAIGVMAWLLPYFTLILAVAGALVIVVAALFRKKMKAMHKRAQEADGKSRSYMQEAVENRLAVKVFGAEKVVSDKSSSLTGEYFGKKYKNEKIAVLAESTLTLFFSLAYVAAIIWGAFSIKGGSMDFGTLSALLQLVAQVQVPIVQLGGIIPAYYAMISSAERLMEIEELTSDLSVPLADAEKFYSAFKSLEIRNAAFSYGRENVLEGVSLEIKKGEFAVIKGISGIGKSTLLKLIMGVYGCTEGEIKFVTEGGEFTPREVKGLFAYVPQGNMLFSGTVRENVCFVKPDADENSVNAALKISCADEFINELPLGINTEVGENGYGLSEGQVQRIAVARALLCGAPLLILDEATSALDAATEERMLCNIRAQGGKTVILVTHKTAAVEMADKIIEIKDKKVTVQ